jgi:hypothetical protein
MIPDTRQVLDPPTPHEHDRVLLKVVPFARDVGGDFQAVAQPDPGDFTQGRSFFGVMVRTWMQTPRFWGEPWPRISSRFREL